MQLISTHAEEALQSMLESLQGKSGQYGAVHYHFSQLQPANRNRFQLGVAANIITDLVHRFEGGIYLCHDGDIIVICQLLDEELADKMTYQLRYLFFDDPLAYTKDQKLNTHFSSYYMTEEAWFDFIAVCRHKIALAGHSQGEKDYDAAWVAKVEHELKIMDTGRLVRSSPVLLMHDDEQMDTIFTHYSMSLGHLCQVFGREYTIERSSPCYRPLATVLDPYLFEHIESGWRLAYTPPLGLKMTIESLCSSLFEKLHHRFQGTSRSNIVICLEACDVFSDMARYYQILSWLHEQGYRLCLEGVDPYMLRHIEREALGFDLLMLSWQPSIGQGDALGRVKGDVLRQDPARVILSNCDTIEAIAIGRAMHLSLFQGDWMEEDTESEEENQEENEVTSISIKAQKRVPL